MVTFSKHLLLLCATCALVACSESIAPEPEGDFRAAEYYWQDNQSDVSYVCDREGATERHDLRFTGERISDTRYDASNSLLAETVLLSATRSGMRTLTGHSAHSLFALPSHLRFKDDITTTAGEVVHASDWLQLDAERYLVADGKSLFTYNIANSSWNKETSPWTSDILEMAFDSTSRGAFTYIVTPSEGIFRKEPNDSSWTVITIPPGTVTDATVDGDGVLFVVINQELKVSQPPYDEWNTFTVTALATNVSSIELLRVSALESILFIGSITKGISEVLLVTSRPAQLSMADRFGTSRIITIRGSIYSPYLAVAISNPPQLQVCPLTVGNWATVPITDSDPLTCVSQSNRSATVLIGTESGMLRFDGAPPAASGLQGKHILSLDYGQDGSFYCGTTDGTYRSLDEGSTWNRIDEQGVITREATGLSLLPESFSLASTWDAGTLLIQGAGELRLTGRVLSHFDELLLPDNTGRFEDVIVVRYAPEDAAGAVLPGQYSWTAYYARNIGPVYIEEMENGSTVAHSRYAEP